MLKKAVLYFYVLLFVSGGLLEKEMSKWDGYWRHFQYHVSKNPDYTFTHFVSSHFINSKTHAWLKDRHKSFPFNKRTMQNGQSLICQKLPETFEVFKIPVVSRFFIPEETLVLPSVISSPVKPPCA